MQPSIQNREVKTLISLALPMMVAQGGLMAMGIVDTLLIGQVSSLEMAAVALGNGALSIVVAFGIGLSMAVEPLVAQAYGVGNSARTRHWLWQGLWMNALVTIPLIALTATVAFSFEPLGVDSRLAERAGVYIWSRIPGLCFHGFYTSIRAYLSSTHRARPIVIAVVAANIVNVAADWLLIFALDLGAIGVGLATSVCWVFMSVIVAWISAVFVGKRVPPDPEALKKLVGIGWPIGLNLSLDIGVFSIVSVLVARMGDTAMAGHQITLSLASFTFMCASGFAVAASARVGVHVGRQDAGGTRTAAFVAAVLTTATMVVFGAIMFVWAGALSQAFAPTDAEAAELGEQLVRITAFFVVFDGLQVVMAGALRGAGDTRWPFYCSTIIYWIVVLPTGWMLADYLELGVSGYWIALTGGALVIAVILMARFSLLSRRSIQRLEQDGAKEPTP